MEIIRRNIYLFEEYNINEYTNLFCSNSYSLSCKNKFKKKKFILIMTDGTSFDELPFIYKPEEHNLTSVFKNFDTEYKLTGSNFETEFTGKYSRNYFYDKIRADNIFRQLYNSKYRLSYLGINLPLYGFLGKEDNVELNKYIIEDEIEKIAFSNLCNITYDIFDKNILSYFQKISDKNLISKISRDEIFEFLDNYFKNEKNDILKDLNLTECFTKQFDLDINNKEERFGIIYYTTTLDEIHHKQSKNYWEAIANSYITNEFLIKIQQFINENPEFALIIISDHGAQNFPLDETLNQHGSNIKGNEGIFLIYTKELGDNFSKLKYDVRTITRYNYATTIPQILEDINIPINSIGKSLIIGNDNYFIYSAVRSKEEQVKGFLSYAKLKFNKYLQVFEKDEEYIQKSEIYDINLYNESYYEKRTDELIQIHLKAVEMIHKKINFYHIFLFFCSLVIFSLLFLWGFLLIKEMLIKDSNNENKLFYEYITIIIIYIFPSLFLFLFPNTIYILTRIRIGYYFLIFFVLFFIAFNKFNIQLIIFKIGRIIVILLFIPIIIYHSIFYLKIFYSDYYIKLLFMFIFYIIYVIYIYYECQKFKDISLNKIKNFNCMKTILIFSLIFLTILFIFDLNRIENTISNFLNLLIATCFIILLFFNTLIVFIGKGTKINNFPLIKLITFFINIYLLNETEKLIMLLIFYPLCEFIFKQYEKQNLSSINFKYLIIIIFIADILTLYTRPKIVPSTDSSRIFRLFFLTKNIIAGLSLQVFYIILSSYYHSISDLTNNYFMNNESFIMRFLFYLKIYIILVYYFFNLFVQKNQIELIYLQSLGIINVVFVVYDNIWVFSFKIVYFLKIKLFKEKYFEKLESDKYISQQNNGTESIKIK